MSRSEYKRPDFSVNEPSNGTAPPSVSTSSIWKSGALRRLPWKGVGAIILSFGGIVGCIAILVISSDSVVQSWSFSPAVYLAIIVAVTNILIHFALTEGATIYWWCQSLKNKTSVGDLHRNWDHGNSFLSALFAGRRSTLLALATILVTITPINGPLLQRASSINIKSISGVASITLDIASELPFGWTGYVSGRGVMPSLLSPNFAPVVQHFTNGSAILLSQTGCVGACSDMRLNGAGFAVNCSSNTLSFDLNPSSTLGPATFDGSQVFLSDYAWTAGEPSQLRISVQYKDVDTCSGFIQIQNCTLNAANVDYPVIINGNSSTIALDPSTTIFDDNVRTATHFGDILYPQPGPSTLAGFALALANQYNSVANIRWVGAVGYELTNTGSTASRYVNTSTVSAYNSNCSLAFNDPMQELLAAARELMFRTAIAAANGTNIQTVSAQQITRAAVYESHYAYMVGALAITLLAMLLVLPSFHGYWQLGRQVSMSPLEIGKAFGAESLNPINSNARADQIVKRLGDNEIRYGLVDGTRMLIAPRNIVEEPTAGRMVEA